ncbi:MAG: GNAT family N-acetyltransferase [Oscillospiraceae bacterium]|nr:GNAT family N-acetyltransferase [Oscillospiraceae bacterium]
MIRRIDSFDNAKLLLRDSHYSRIILSHILAYGTEFDFCEFYELLKGNKRIGIFASMNSLLTVDLLDDARSSSGCIRETEEFIRFKYPMIVEMPEVLIPRRGLSEYRKEKRYFFSVPASEGVLEEKELLRELPYESVFETAFAGQDANYGLWLTDTVRRVNRGIVRIYGYRSAVLTVKCQSYGRAYLADIATPEEDRGKGYASTLIRLVSQELKKEGIECYLASDESMRDFYLRLGCTELGEDYILKLKERKDYEELV